MNWIKLRQFGRNKIFRSSYFWLVFVPIVARVITPLNEELSFQFPFLNNGDPIDLALPFSWQVLFYASLAISIGNLIYQLFVPEIVHKYPTYKDLQESGEGSRKIRYSMLELIKTKITNDVRFDTYFKDHKTMSITHEVEDETEEFLRDLAYSFIREQATPQEIESFQSKVLYFEEYEGIDKYRSQILEYLLTRTPIADTMLLSMYNKWASKEKVAARWFCTCFYIVGMILIGALIVQNIIAVVKLTIG